MQKHKDLDKLHSYYSSLLSSLKQHDILKAQASAEGISNLEDGFWERLEQYLTQSQQEIEDLKAAYTDSEGYMSSLVELIEARGIACEHEGSSIQIGPITLTAHIQSYYLQIRIGRKKQQYNVLDPSLVARHVEKIYKRLNNSFNAKSFFKRLQKAYELCSMHSYGSREPKYGYAVALKDIFDLFTISPAASDYKLENFLWDLGRLHNMASAIEQYTIELGYSRDAKKMYLIRTAGGENISASTLTLHLIAENE